MSDETIYITQVRYRISSLKTEPGVRSIKVEFWLPDLGFSIITSSSLEYLWQLPSLDTRWISSTTMISTISPEISQDPFAARREFRQA